MPLGRCVATKADANEDKRKKKRKTIEERVAEKQKLEEAEKKEREKDRKGTELQRGRNTDRIRSVHFTRSR